MLNISLFCGCSLAALMGIAHAGELLPMNAQSIALGQVTGIAYYTVEADGYRVVVTLASGPESTPIRYVSTLISGQSIVLSVPQGFQQPALEFQITRNGDSVTVGDALAVAVVVE